MKTCKVPTLVAILVLLPALGAAGERPVRKRPLLQSTRLSLPQPSPLQIDSTLACFEGFLSTLVNPGCFEVSGQPLCTSRSGHFMIQYMIPDVGVPHRVLGFAFLNNDGDTVFPSGGILVIQPENQIYPWPTPNQLANLQVRNIVSPTDTSVAFVDLESAGITIEPGSDAALVVALEFPSSGVLEDVGIGPGIVCDGDVPDQKCDFFTLDGGLTDQSWFAPCGPDDGPPDCPDNPPADPLDWGFVVLLDPILSIESVTWTAVKRLYRTP